MRPAIHVRAERAPFVMLPRWLLYHPEVGEGAKFLYCVLHDLVHGSEGPTRPVTRAKLAELSRVSPNTIDRRLTELITARAVDKEPQILAGGQIANVYHVWLTPPDQRQRQHHIPPNGEARSERIPTDEDPLPTDLVPVDKRVPTDGEARSQGIPMDGDPPHRWGSPLPADGDPTVLKEELQEIPPHPRTAGGPSDASHNDNGLNLKGAIVEAADGDRNGKALGHPSGGRRSEGTNPRAIGANPRAAAELAAAERERERAARLEAEAEAKTSARLAAERAGEAGRVAFEAEALAVSAILDDDQLDAVVKLVRAALIGPLAQSALPVSRSVVDWCRHAAANHLDSPSLAAAIDAALAVGQALPSDPAPPLTLAAAPSGGMPLRRRVADLMASMVAVF
jgi:hypothetical protein